MDRTEIESFTHARLLKLIEIKNPTGLEEDLLIYNPQIQISEKSQTKRPKIADSGKTKRPKIDKRTTPNKQYSNAIITAFFWGGVSNRRRIRR